MKKRIFKIILRVFIAVVAVLLAAFIAIEIFLAVYNPVSTTLALNYHHEELMTVDGMIFRNESYVTYSDDRVLDYTVNDGQKVSLGDTIALAYANGDDAALGKRIEELNEQINTIKNNSAVNDYYLLDLDRIKDEIKSALYGISGAIGENGISSLYESVEEMKNTVTRKQAATGGNPDFSAKIAELENEIKTLDESISKSPKSVKTSKAGYFFSRCDGYENSVDLSTVTSMTAEDYKNITPSEIPENAVGKIGESYEWYYLFTVDKFTAQSFAEKSTIELRFPVSGAKSFPATVMKVNYTDDEALVILYCTYMSSDYAVDRNQTVQIITGRTEGLFVDSEAIRINDGVTGVYVLIGVEVKFRKLDVLYTCDEFIIAAPGKTGSDTLQLYDYIITKGNGLYDGKLIYAET